MKNSTIFYIVGAVIVMIIYGSFDPAHHLFPKCPLRWMTGLLCPGCGSQRAIHAALHGHFFESFKLNFLFMPTVLYAITGVVMAGLFPAKWPVIRSRYYGSTAAYVSLAVVLIYWIGRNIFQIAHFA